MKIPKNSQKKTVLILCIMTYIMVYLCRLNFSTAILKIADALHTTTTTMGIVGSLFFLSYGIGQLINGFIGDRVAPIRFIIMAIIGTGSINIAITQAQSIGIIALLWSLNGYFQSAFWGTLNRILSFYYGNGEHHIVSTGLSLSMVASYILSWAVLGKLLTGSSWQTYFLIPAAVAFFMLITWFTFAQTEQVIRQEAAQKTGAPFKNLWYSFRKERLWIICIICVFTGLVKEGVGLWAPTIFLNILGGNANQAFLLIVLIPLGNFCGIMATKSLLKRNPTDGTAALLVMEASLFVTALLFVIGTALFPPSGVVFTALVSGMAFGCNSIMLSYIPLSYSKHNMVATLIGIFNFFAYIGAAVSAYVLGISLSGDHWFFIPYVWMAAGGFALVFVLLLRRKKPTE